MLLPCLRTEVKVCADDDEVPIAAHTPLAFDGRVMLLNGRAGTLVGGLMEQDGQNAMERESGAYSLWLQVRVSAGDRARIREHAVVAGLSVSAYLRAAGLGHPIRSVLDYDAVRDLAKLNGDQGRLGGLLKLWLEDRPGRGAPEVDVRRLLERIDDLQSRLIDVVSRV
jgi:hypothetical protein